MLTATILVLLVSATVVIGVSFSVNQYNRSKMRSESHMLCSTLAEVIRTELANTRTITLGSRSGSGSVYTLKSFFSKNYAVKQGQTAFYSVKVDRQSGAISSAGSGYGELMLGAEKNGNLYGNLLLGSASYTEYGLGAKVESVTYDITSNIFHVELSVGKDGTELVSRSFDVLPLNEIENIERE